MNTITHQFADGSTATMTSIFSETCPVVDFSDQRHCLRCRATWDSEGYDGECMKPHKPVLRVTSYNPVLRTCSGYPALSAPEYRNTFRALVRWTERDGSARVWIGPPGFESRDAAFEDGMRQIRHLAGRGAFK